MDAGMQRIPCLTQLGRVTLRKTKITNRGFEQIQHFPLLETLYIGTNNNVTDDTLKYVQRLTQLQNLELAGTKVTDTGLESLRGLPRMMWLDLSKTGITDNGLTNLYLLPTCGI